MLTETSYLTAIYVYAGAGLLVALCLAWWLGRRWGGGWTSLLVLLCAALLLTPAFPREGADTMAPALVVAAFQLLTDGMDAARHALRPLAYACGLAVVLALLLRLTVFRRRRADS
ncbi:MAG: hypothetical protein CME59_15175 [Halioglobus sp.]|nr:hypothetical protein [Halioglobus sp.]